MSVGFLDRDQAERLCQALANTLSLEFLPGTRNVLVVKETPTHAVTVLPTTFNWRLATWPLRDLTGSDRGWCYLGPQAFAIAYLQACLWPDDDTGVHVPALWYRDVNTDERRAEFLFT